MEKPPELLIVTPSFSPEVGGVETRLDDLCDVLEARGIPTAVETYQPIITRARGAACERRGSVTVRRHWWPGGDLFHRLLRHPFWMVIYLMPGLLFWSGVRLGRHRGRIRALHALGLNAALVGYIWRPFFRFRWVVTTHAIYDFRPGSLFARVAGRVLRGADRVLALSDASRRELVAIGVPAERVETHLTWVNNRTRFVPGDRPAARRELGFPEEGFLVLFAGRMRANKGVGVLLEVARRRPDWLFVFAGEGEMAAAVQAASVESPRVRYAGGVANARLARYYQAADVFVMPSQYSEGFGRVAIEALSCGVPVVLSKKGGIRDHVDRAVAVLVEPEPDPIEEALADLAARPDSWPARRAACRAFAMAHFSEANAEQVLRAYFQDSIAEMSDG